jgi:hypothetical protein
MTLRKRIDSLEGNRPDPAPPLDLDLAPDLAQRIRDTQSAGTFPASLSTADLEAINDAVKAREAKHERPE